MLRGAPPCSPQTPTLRARRGAGHPRDGATEWRARAAGEAPRLAERDAARVAAVLAADADLQVRARPAPALDRDPDQLAHPHLVERLERILGEDAALHVG